MAEKEVKVKVVAETDIKDIEDLEDKLQELHEQKLKLQLEADTEELKDVNFEIDEIKDKISDLKSNVEINDEEIVNLENEIESAQSLLDVLKADVDVDDSEIEELEDYIDDLKNQLTELKAEVEVDNSEIEELELELQELEDKQLQLTINTEYTELEDVEARIEELEQKRIDIYLGVDDSELQEVEDEIEALENRQIDLTVNVDSGNIDDLNNNIDEIQQNSQQTTDSINGLGTAIAGVGAAAGFDKMVTTADNINNSWRRVKFAFDSAGISEDQVKQSMEGLGDATGRTGGQMRDFYTLMGNSGIKNLDAIRQGFETVSAGAYKTGNDITTVENAMQRMVMSGNTGAMMLKRVGINLEDLAKAMGVSVDEVADKFKELTPEERLNAINQAMSNSKEINNEFKDSFAALKAQAEAALLGLLGAVGQSILPVVIPMLKTATDIVKGLTEGFKGLPPEVQGIIGTFAGLVLGGTVLVTALGLVGKGIGAVRDGLRNIKSLRSCDSINNSARCWKDYVQKLKDVASNAKTTAIALGNTLKTALKNVAESAKNAALAAVDLGKKILTAGYNALKAAGMWLVEKAQLIASTIAKGAATVASYALAVAEWLAASPILLVVIAIVALIAILWYLYNTNESVRNAIDGFIDALWSLGETIYGALMGAFEWLQGAWQNTVDFFTNGANSINEGVTGAFNWLRDSIVGTFTNIYETIMGIWQGIVDWLTNGVNTINETVTPALQWLTDGLQWLSDLITGSVMGAVQWLIDQFSWLSDIWNQVSTAFTTYAPLIAQVLFVMATGGVGAIVLLIANFMGMPNQIGGALQSVITRVAGFVGDIVGRLGNGARQAVSNFASGISNLGQALQRELQGMLNDAANFVGQIGQIMWNAAVNAWNNFLNGLQRHSPGKMMREWNAEISGIVQIGEDAEKPLGESMTNLAKSAVSNFNPILSYGGIEESDVNVNTNNDKSRIEDLLNQIVSLLNNKNSSEDSFTFNLYGDMDKEERMQEFLEYVRKYLEWKNDTAGRTI